MRSFTEEMLALIQQRMREGSEHVGTSGIINALGQQRTALLHEKVEALRVLKEHFRNTQPIPAHENDIANKISVLAQQIIEVEI